MICSGCTVAVRKRDNDKCPFCRTPTPTSKEEINEREKKRMEAGDAIAIHNIGYYYAKGLNGFPQNWGKAIELFHRAAELGYTRSYGAIGLLFFIISYLVYHPRNSVLLGLHLSRSH